MFVFSVSYPLHLLDSFRLAQQVSFKHSLDLFQSLKHTSSQGIMGNAEHIIICNIPPVINTSCPLCGLGVITVTLFTDFVFLHFYFVF